MIVKSTKFSWHKRVATSIMSVFVLTSCLVEKPDLQSTDGPPMAQKQLAAAIEKAWGAFQPETMGEGEYVYTVKAVKISNSNPKVTADYLTQIIDVCHDSTQKEMVYTVAQTVREFGENGEPTEVTTQRPLIVADPPETGSATVHEAGLHEMMAEETSEKLLQVYDDQEFVQPDLAEGIVRTQSVVPLSPEIALYVASRMCVPQKGENFGCYNLKTSTIDEDLPSVLRESGKCVGFPGCRWQRKIVSFDVIAEGKDENGNSHRQKTRISLGFTPQTPFLARLTSYCQSGLAKINGKTYPVEICDKVQDLRARTVVPDPTVECPP